MKESKLDATNQIDLTYTELWPWLIKSSVAMVTKSPEGGGPRQQEEEQEEERVLLYLNGMV